MNQSLSVALNVYFVLGVLSGSPSASQTPQQPAIIPRAEPAVALKPRRSLRAHHRDVYDLAYTRNGKLLASVGADGLVKFWDTTTGQCVRSFRAPTECLALSPDGRWLATGNFASSEADERTFVWLALVRNARSGRIVRKLVGHKGPVSRVAWSSNGKWLATASRDGSVKIWSTGTWRPKVTLRETFRDLRKGNGVTANQALFSPDGRTLAVVSVATLEGEPSTGVTRVVLWDTATWKSRRMLMEERMCWNAVLAFTPDSRRLVAASTEFASDGNVYAWDVPDGNRHIVTQGQEASPAAALVPPGRWLVAGGKEWTAFLLDLRTGKVVAGLPHPTEVNTMAASPDGRTVATGDANGTIRLWPIPAQAQPAAKRQ